MIAKSPCLRCEDRVLGCHAGCSRYMAYKAENERVRNARNAENAIESEYMDAKEAAFKRLKNWR